ncbi:MAG: hypothetical protein J5651_06755 [Salinivirgaceae bacterium]|nr:hypothetical protein [Salinivirgaceae bacterium]
MTKEQYISNLHDSFVNFINHILSLADMLILLPQATDYDKRELDKVKLMLKGKDAKSIEKELSDGTFSCSTLDRIEKLYKDLTDFGLEHIHESEIWKMLVKQMCYSNIENGKKDALVRLEEIKM